MSTPVRSKTFTPADSFWLKLEAPTSTTLIAGLLVFHDPVDYRDLRDQISDRLLRFDRFRQRPRESILPLVLPVWEPAPDFDLDAHLHCTTLPEPGDWPQLKAFIEELLSRPLPRHRPLWQWHLIPRYGSGSALVACYSHVIADGFGSMHLLESITDPAPDAPAPPRAPEPLPLGLGDRLAAAAGAVETAARLPGKLVRGALGLTRDPSPAIREARYRLEEGQALARYTFMPPDRRTALRGPSTYAKRVAAAEPIDLAELKALSHAFGVTINDLIATAVAGAFRRYLAGRGEQVDGLTLHAMMPYNLRPPERSGELGNGFSLVFLPLPVGIADPVERLQEVKRKADFVKAHPEAPMSFLVGSAMGFLPAPLTRLGAGFFSNKVSTVLTNVPGLPETRYMAGRRIDRVMFWAPHANFLTMDVAVLSYAGRLTVCFNGDARAVPDLETLAGAFEAEFAELEARRPAAPAVDEPVRGSEPEEEQPAEAALEAAAEAHAPALGEMLRPVGSDLSIERCRCQAITKAGQPCRNYAQHGSDYCRAHAALAVDA